MLNKIECIIKPYKLDDVKDALQALGIQGITVTEVQVCGTEKGHKEVYRGVEYVMDYLPKLKVEVVVPREQTDRIVETMMFAARNGKISNDRIYVLPIERAVRIRTGELDECAVSFL